MYSKKPNEVQAYDSKADVPSRALNQVQEISSDWKAEWKLQQMHWNKVQEISLWNC